MSDVTTSVPVTHDIATFEDRETLPSTGARVYAVRYDNTLGKAFVGKKNAENYAKTLANARGMGWRVSIDTCEVTFVDTRSRPFPFVLCEVVSTAVVPEEAEPAIVPEEEEEEDA